MSRRALGALIGGAALVAAAVLSVSTVSTQAAWQGSVSGADNWVAVKVTSTGPTTCAAAATGGAGTSAVVAFAMDESQWDYTLKNLVTSPSYGNGWYNSAHTPNPRTSTYTACLNDSGSSAGFADGQSANGPWLPVKQLGGSASVEIWFRTTSTGGLLIGLGNSNSGLASTRYDRQLFVNRNGRLVFAVTDGTADHEVVSAANVTDNAWHHAVGTIGAHGSRLYLDGRLVGSDSSATSVAGTLDTYGNGTYWPGAFVEIAYDSLARWSNDPGASRWDLNGSLAYGAYYDSELTASEVQAHYAASGRS